MAAWLNPKADLLPSDGLLPPMVPMLPCVAPRLPPGTVPPGYRLLDSLGPAPGRFLSSSVGAYISALGLFIFFVMMAEAFRDCQEFCARGRFRHWLTNLSP
jgi:hypothetical protein